MIGEWLAQHPAYGLSGLRFQDLAKSGWNGDHIKEGGNFGKLLIAIERGKIQKGDVVLVEAIDRAGRLPVLDMISKIVSPILKAGVSIVTLEDGVVFTEDSLNQGGHIYILVGKIQAARLYSDNLSHRLKGSYASRRKLAAAGTTPKRNTPVWLTSEGEVIETVATQVRLAFELYVSGVGKAVIAKRMRDSGMPALAKTSGPGVEGWLRNEAAIGRWNGMKVYDPIIDLSLFHLAQLEGKRRKTAPKVKTATHFYVGLVKCGSCGGNFIMRTIRGVQVSMRCRKRQELKGCDNKKVIPKEIIDTVYRHTSVRAAHEAVAKQQMGVNEKAIIAEETKLQEINDLMSALAATVRIAKNIPELAAQLNEVQAAREASERTLARLKATVVPAEGLGWQRQGQVWGLEKDDPQRLAAMLRGVGYTITIHPDKRLVSSHSEAVYRYAGVDRATGRYKLMAGDKHLLILKDAVAAAYEDEPLPDDEMIGESSWTQEDYLNLQAQYKKKL